MAAVLDGRGEGENINLVADALHRTGYLEKLFDADRVQPRLKGTVKKAVNMVDIILSCDVHACRRDMFAKVPAHADQVRTWV